MNNRINENMHHKNDESNRYDSADQLSTPDSRQQQQHNMIVTDLRRDQNQDVLSEATRSNVPIVGNDSLFSLTSGSLYSLAVPSCFLGQGLNKSSTRCNDTSQFSSTRSKVNYLRDVISLALDVCDDIQVHIDNDEDVPIEPLIDSDTSS
jgi:hypothetical protein